MIYSREKLLELLERYLKLASEGNETLRQVADEQKTQIAALESYIAQNPREDQAQLSRVVDGFVALQNRLLDELERSKRENESLQKNLNEAEAEVRLDPLTHIFNRRKLEEDVTHLLNEQKPDRIGLYMLIVDADDFKKINDNHGHLAGDKVLLYLVRAFKAILGQNNHLYRYGGEEFVVLSLQTRMDEAMALAENIRAKVAATQMHHQSRPIQLTVSIGLAPAQKDDTYETLFAKADHALFQAKSEGKNRVVVSKN
ncbi:MAG: GGDEF domain-containing protein [Campylobacterales bacterium]